LVGLSKTDFSSLLEVRFAVGELSKKPLLETSVINFYQVIDNSYENYSKNLD